jgi:hypothetical protein
MGWQVLIQPMSIPEFWPCPTTIEMHEKKVLKPSQIGTTLDASSWKSINITNLNTYNQIRKTNPTT